jgi:UDP-N-acetylmuramoyl-tripeptide--D-alanyl-D-alanine ligase
MATPIPQNHCEFRMAEAQAATRGELTGNDSRVAHGVSTDSRIVEPGMLFVALAGQLLDGHRYVAEAMGKGAAAAIVGSGHREAASRIEVADTLVALGDLARHHVERSRKGRDIRSIAIGGASGKTTTKELTAAALRALFGDTLATPGNLNNRIGVPMTLFTLKDCHRAMVIECGTNARGEIEKIGRIVAPDVAMVLNVDIEHTEGLRTIENVADEEAALFSCAGQAIVYGADEPLLRPRLPREIRAISFGQSESADVRVTARRASDNGGSLVGIGLAPKLFEGGRSTGVEISLRLAGTTSALNCAAALAGAIAALGRPITPQELSLLSMALGAVGPAEGRMMIRRGGQITLIDDTYNANPRSVRAALKSAREIADRERTRLVVALGDMLELGELSKQSHFDMMHDVAEANPAVFIAVGPCTSGAVRSSGGALREDCEVVMTADAADAAKRVSRIVRQGDLVLIKGSRGMQMEALVRQLEPQWTRH